MADVADVLANPQLAHRGFWDHVDGDGGPRPVPGNPVPAATVHTSGPGDRPRPSTVSARRRARDDLPLDGIVVVDFTAFWAGPERDPDARRPRGPGHLGGAAAARGREPDASADATEVVMHYFHHKMNRNKESVVLDLQTDAGRDLARRLAVEADVARRELPARRDGRLRARRRRSCARRIPALVYVSLSGFGSTGPWSDRRSYGPTIEAASSIEARTGYAGDEPLRLGHTLPDGVGGLVGALAALRGLRERDERGVGGWFDVSQLEAYVALSGEDLLLAR